jgi:hypothetical protein
MFLPSADAIRHLCDALHALKEPQKLLGNYGLVDPNSYLDYDENDAPYPRKPSWEELKNELVQAREKKSEQLRNMCGELLRRRNDNDWFYEHPLDSCPQARFQDALVQFEATLLVEGYKFDGFSVLGTPVQSVVQRADEALSNALKSSEFSQSDKVREHLSEAIRMLGQDRYNDSLTQFRLALQHCLKAIAFQIAERLAEELPTFREDWEVREYLEKKGFFTREERKGFDGVYGLLSSGAHGKGDKNLASLGYATCIMACHYAFTKFSGSYDNKPVGTA